MKLAAIVLLAFTTGCSSAPRRSTVRIIGSDTMVNLLQAWAEHYRDVRPDVSVQIAGGGSGVGLAGLVDGTLDVAAASREIRTAERARVTARTGTEPREFPVAMDAIAVYVHTANPLRTIAVDDLAEIYGEGGRLTRWSQLGLRIGGCPSDRIIPVGRQNNSGTYTYFRQVVLGPAREYALGSIDQSGSKDVVALVSTTPCAIGYSGIAFATPRVRALGLAPCRGCAAVSPGAAAVLDGSYPLARRLYLYTATEPDGAVKAFLDWILTTDGQRIAQDLGFVPVRRP
jgi:phosphate transport system substrate-binding protein